MARHYEIDEAKKIIFADILALTEKEEAEVAKYVKYGFAVEPRTKKAEKVARLDEEYILNYLKDNQEALDTFAGKKNETATDEAGKVKHVGHFSFAVGALLANDSSTNTALFSAVRVQAILAEFAFE